MRTGKCRLDQRIATWDQLEHVGIKEGTHLQSQSCQQDVIGLGGRYLCFFSSRVFRRGNTDESGADDLYNRGY